MSKNPFDRQINWDQPNHPIHQRRYTSDSVIDLHRLQEQPVVQSSKDDRNSYLVTNLGDGESTLAKMLKNDSMFRGFKRHRSSRLMDLPGTLDPQYRHKRTKKEAKYFNDLQIYAQLSWFRVQWFVFVVLGISFLVTIAVPNLRTRTLQYMKLWQWEVLGLAAIAGHIIWDILIGSIVIAIEKQYICGPGILYFLYPLQKTLGYFMSFTTLLVLWHSFFQPSDITTKNEKEIDEFALKIIKCLIVSSTCWLLKIVCLKWLGASFYKHNYFEPIKKALFAWYVIRTLLAPQEDISQMTGGSDEVIACQGALEQNGKKKLWDRITFDQWSMMDQNNLNIWWFWSLVKIIRTKEFNERLQHVIPDDPSNDGLSKCKRKAIAVAQEIGRRISRSGKSVISVEDLNRFMPVQLCEELLKVVEAVSRNESSDEIGEIESVSKVNFMYWVVITVKERRALEVSLTDSKAAFKALNRNLSFTVGLVTFATWLVIMKNLATMNLFMFVIAVLGIFVALAGDPIKRHINSVLFFLYDNTVDIGDACTVQGEEMVVEEKHLRSTVFLTSKNERVPYPNHILSEGKPIKIAGTQAVVTDVVEEHAGKS